VIYGIGVDLVQVSRIAESLARYGERFEQRVLHPDELPRLDAAKDRANVVAKSFAVTEAFAKALGTGVRDFKFRDIGTRRDDLGRPTLVFSDRVHAKLAERGIRGSHVSLSDDAGFVVAMVVLET